MSRYIDADALIAEIKMDIEDDGLQEKMVFYRINEAPSIEPKAKVIAQVTFDEEKMREIVKEAVERFKEEYEITDRPQGHYIKGENGEWYCSNCKRIDDKYSVANFCWHCGARMFAKDINVPYKIASDQRDYDSTYEPTYNEQDGSM